MNDVVIEGPHKAAEPGDWDGIQFAHYERTPEGFRLMGISRSPTTLRTAR